LLFPTVIFSQEKFVKEKGSDETKLVSEKMTVKDIDANVLIEVTDEGDGGSIYLPHIAFPLVETNKLFNSAGRLYWNGDELGTAASGGGWTDDGTVVRLRTITDKVGIGTSTPNAGLHVNSNEGVLFGGTEGFGTALNLGAGTRMMWYPKKAAFRTGYVDQNQWNDSNIGDHSIAMGWCTIASGNNSIATGEKTIASGFVSTAMGGFTKASHQYSTAIGYGTEASGSYSTAIGGWTKAESYISTAIGRYNIGGGTVGSWVETDPLFEIGIGSSEMNRANAVTVLKNGNVGIGTSSPSAPLHVTGEDGVLFTGTYGSGSIPIEGVGSRMMWYPKKIAFRAGSVNSNQWNDTNIGDNSMAMGVNTTASGDASTAMGVNTTASGDFSTAMGYLTIANSDYSAAMGYLTTASGNFSTAMGSHTTASGNNSTTMGRSTNAQSYASTAIGHFNVGGGTINSWVNTDPLFEIGNGTDDLNRENAVTVLKNGNVGIGTTNSA